MRIGLLTNIISPHQLPLAEHLVKHIGEANYHYVYTEQLHAERQRMGWGEDTPEWCQFGDEHTAFLENAELLYSELRSFELFEKRLAQDKLTFYVSERWLKPKIGGARMVSPRYVSMARQFLRLLEHPKFYYLAQGIHAARDILRIDGLRHGHINCMWNAPAVAFESRPGGGIFPLKSAIDAGVITNDDVKIAKRNGFCQVPREHWGKLKATGIYSKMRIWGYFVADSKETAVTAPNTGKCRVLWVGRMLDWKRVDTLVKACRGMENLELDLYGHGSEDEKLHALASGYTNIHFHDFVPIQEVRKLMHQYDVYVLPSDGTEGWGAVLNEALIEGMKVVATTGCGSGATVLPASNLFSTGAVGQLRQMLTGEISAAAIGCWTASQAAENMVKLYEELSL